MTNLYNYSAIQYQSIIEKFSEQKIIILGDLIADEFVYGEIARISREAPVLILRHEKTATMPGGAGNTAANVAALGAQTSLIGIVGRDRAGRNLTTELRRMNVDTQGIISTSGHKTPTKTRVLAGSNHSPRQQVIRIDSGDESYDLNDAEFSTLEKILKEKSREATAIILSDYDYGTVDSRLIPFLQKIKKQYSIPIVIDSRFRLKDFSGFTSATPSQIEVEQLLGAAINKREQLLQESENFRNKLNLESLLVTCGPEGMILAQENFSPISIPAVGSKEPVDVTGAGDTVIAAYAIALAAGATFEEAMHLANHAAGQVVMKRGTATVTREEVVESLQE